MNDTILQGLLKHDTIRFAAITGRELVTEAQRIHALSRTATAALGRELLMVAMMAGQLKNDTDSVSAILSGGGPGGNLVCVGRKGPFVKGCAGDPACELPPKPNGKLDVGGYVGRNGKLTVVRDLSLKEPYVGMCHLVWRISPSISPPPSSSPVWCIWASGWSPSPARSWAPAACSSSLCPTVPPSTWTTS